MGRRDRKKPRLNLELDHATKARLDGLYGRTNAASLTEVIRRALHLYEVVIESGGEIIVRTDAGDKTILVL